MDNGNLKDLLNPHGTKIMPEFDPLTAALRAMHDSMISDPVPDDFLDLLDMIDAKMSARR